MRCPPRRPMALASAVQASDSPVVRGARYGIDVLVHPLLLTSSSRMSVRRLPPDPRYATRVRHHPLSQTLPVFANSATACVASETQRQAVCCMRSTRQQRFARARSSVPAARRFAGDTLAGWGIVERWGDMRFCASELAANAVLHGAPPGRDFGVRLVREPGRVLIEVRDSGPGLPVIQCSSPEAPAGRGLWLVKEVADEFGVLDEPVGKTAWVAFEAWAVR
ncbi:ATP-binding protein [Streptomyces sp. NPDC058734]|uniref:ATP-binding protein n=1 Tax=Streptomyces sp. NPDC058734 TaxID=3346615 RepID=UPI00368E9062